MDEQRAAVRRLLDLARPFLDSRDHDGLSEALRKSWSPDCLTLLLKDRDDDVVAVSAVCLGLIGDISAGPALAGLLGHENLLIVDAAENALWAIWFRDGGPVARAVLYRLAQGVQERRTEKVTAMLTELVRSQPTYAEAFHQRAQAHYLDNEFASALRDAKRAFELNPLHFAALALSGHCYAVLGRYQDAIKTYREVLRIYPKMPGIRDSMREIRERFEPALSARVPA